ncbi:putative adenylate kinase 1 [Morus notabilis]|uniref:adenylate kinase n=1 Tax=Morus notabilis TaxID=981085 RepID=W9S4M0_9ROSA|nr:probable adenylate kinase 6, chloroplastic [Morus notabilis]EXB88488.1 putative adenylate kinase 1 [Morus notabilis]
MAALRVSFRALRPSSSSSSSSNSLVFSLVRYLSSSSSSSSSSSFVDSGVNLQKPANGVPLRRKPNGRNDVHWVFLGCPGVGKGTYASRLSNLLGVLHIATGDLIREELASSGPLAPKLAEVVNRGKLVSDEIVIDLLSNRLQAGEAKGESGFILDGFPRTIRQAEILEGVIDIDLVINLKLREDALLAKCLGRRICSECGGNFNIACIDIKGEDGKPGIYMPPLDPPPHCASKLITRSDDTEEVVKERLRVYNEMSQPLEEFYRSRGKLLEFDLPGGIPESWPKLLQALNLEDHDQRSAAA